MRQRFEHHRQPLLPRADFLRRLLLHGLAGLLVMAGSLGLGVLGYRLTGGMPWLDALLNASMILSGMGPVDAMTSAGGKLFASFYALFSGIVFLAVASLVLAPVAHRILHRLHLAE
jgi:hypothetical protein